MATGYILYNPLAGNGTVEQSVEALQTILPETTQCFDVTKITNYKAFLAGMDPEDYLVITGGDGTLNRFVNDVSGMNFPQDVLYYPAGSGNDFARDMDQANCGSAFAVKQWIQELPTVEVNGHTYRFINGVGFGIDGYCCQVGDELKQTPGKKVDYTAIAIKGLLVHFQPRNAQVVVDGQHYSYQKVWIAPTMLGRFYGGGMIPAPLQRRTDPERKLSVTIFGGAGRLRTLCVFPSIFKGEHVKHTKQVAVHTGHEITVTFDRPTPLQIDGETIPNVTSYTARWKKER